MAAEGSRKPKRRQGESQSTDHLIAVDGDDDGHGSSDFNVVPIKSLEFSKTLT